jgi:hypothetical protein
MEKTQTETIRIAFTALLLAMMIIMTSMASAMTNMASFAFAKPEKRFNTVKTETLGRVRLTTEVFKAPKTVRAFVYCGEIADEIDEVFIDTSSASEGFVGVSVFSDRRVKVKVGYGAAPRQYDIYDVKNDGSVNFFPVTKAGSDQVTIEVMRKVSDDPEDLYYIQIGRAAQSYELSDSRVPYLEANVYVPYDSNSECVQIASKIAAECNTEAEFIDKTSRFIMDALEYSENSSLAVKNGHIINPDEILHTGKAVCYEYAVLTAAMMRSQGIPTKVCVGKVDNSATSHAWNEVYVEGTGWMNLDLTFKDAGVNPNTCEYITETTF